MQPLTLTEFKEYAKKAGKTVVFEEIPAGNLSPVEIYELLYSIYQADGVLLENLQEDLTNRYAYICFEPRASLSIPYGSTLDPLNELRNFQSKFQYATRDNIAHLMTKMIGFITYDAASAFENTSDHHARPNGLPLCLFHLFNLNLTFNYVNKTILISTLVEVGTNVEITYLKTREKVKNIINKLTTPSLKNKTVNHKKSNEILTVDISDADFMRMVKKAKEYIIRGEAFQIVLSRSFTRRFSVPAFSIYQMLCQVSPAPFMFYFPTQTQIILGASPERLVRVQKGKITVNPIAGTCKRNNQSKEMIRDYLLNHEKELAEHMMLVDLARNDVGTISKPRSIKIDELLKIKHYSHVSHIASTINGQLHEKYDAIDALKATLPAGTLSGAPKIRAMQIIDKLEKTPRGLYGGAICRFDGADQLDSCIAIRMAILKNGFATIRAGAGITYDSDPYAEMQETYQKASALLDAIAKAEGECLT